jgi:hypothetical protein
MVDHPRCRPGGEQTKIEQMHAQGHAVTVISCALGQHAQNARKCNIGGNRKQRDAERHRQMQAMHVQVHRHVCAWMRSRMNACRCHQSEARGRTCHASSGSRTLRAAAAPHQGKCRRMRCAAVQPKYAFPCTPWPGRAASTYGSLAKCSSVLVEEKASTWTSASFAANQTAAATVKSVM